MRPWRSLIWHLEVILEIIAETTRKRQSDLLVISVIWKGGRVV